MTDFKNLTAFEFEQRLMNRVNNQSEGDPLDSCAAMFKFFIPRFKGQLNNMSKKQIIKMTLDLCSSEFNQQSDVNKIIPISKDLGLNALIKVVAAAIESPLFEVDVSFPFKNESNLFQLIDGLLTNKYFSCLKRAKEEQIENPEKKVEIENLIAHNVNIESKEFKKREKVEKDGFFTGNKLLFSKFYMMLIMTENLSLKEQEKNG